MYLSYDTSFVSMMIRDEWYVGLYAVTPEEFANYKPKFTSRDTTEFHPSLIDNYPEAKKTMQNWIKRSAEFQYNWEVFLKAKKSQKLDLSNYIEGTKKINNTNLKATNSIADQLKTLHDLYKSGALSGYEYELAKKKILNK
ncbi:SHOCT domain-containing protein [Candidatus Pelagibacter bacterium]|nr:SHOCT domain-containing protein [Candidatus Pelagibacter bacterium]